MIGATYRIVALLSPEGAAPSTEEIITSSERSVVETVRFRGSQGFHL